MVNISFKDVMAQKIEKEEAAKKTQAKKKNYGNFEFDERHYLNTRLSEGENSKEIVIRLLPFSEENTSPFFKIHVHSIKAKNENGEIKWKKFMCPVKMGKAEKCPICETAEMANKHKFEFYNDEKLREDYWNVQKMYSPKDYWLVRCIDRAHEEDGVKFWRFPDLKNGNGIFDKFWAIIDAKQKRGVDVLDIYNGKDFIVTVTRTIEGSKEKMTYQIQDDEERKQLADTEEQMEKWVDDPMKWEDVYTIKDYDYLDLVVNGKYPVWSKEDNKWVAKEERTNSENDNNGDSDDDVEDLSLFGKDEETTNKPYVEDDDDDLPF